MATCLWPADYAQAQRLRGLLRRDYADAFARVDVIEHPCLPVPAPEVGKTIVTIGNEAEPPASALIRLNDPANHAGVPAIAVPCGLTATGLPISLQIMARPRDEATVLRVAHAYEQQTDWHTRRPPVWGAQSSLQGLSNG